VGEALFFLFFFAVGGIGLAWIAVQYLLPEWRVRQDFVQGRCIVVDRRLLSRTEKQRTYYRPEVVIRYEVEGRPFETQTFDIHQSYSSDREQQQQRLEQFEVGRSYTCWYDPQDPSRAVMLRDSSLWMWLLSILPASFLLIGGAGTVRAILQSTTSAERRSALAGKATGIDLFDNARAHEIDYPQVPRTVNVTDSPGTRLAYRLPAELASGWRFFGTSLVCFFWNGVVLWAVVRVIVDFRSGRAGPLALLVVLLFVLGGAALAYQFIRRLRQVIAVGTTLVEIASHPLHPGQSCDLLIVQSGRTRVRSFEALLVCEEEASYLQGTDARTARQRVYQQRVVYREAVDVEPGHPLECDCVLKVPRTAMHSFKSQHNEIKWKLLVRAEMSGWTDFEKGFPMIVHPEPGLSTEPTAPPEPPVVREQAADA
jgi:hypothetical protein